MRSACSTCSAWETLKKNSEHTCIGSVNYTGVFIVFLHISAQHAVHDKFEQWIQNMS